MTILYWNLKRNANEDWIVHIIQENNVDIALFSEYERTDFNKSLKSLSDQYVRHDGMAGCDKVTLLCKNSIETTVKREQNRYTLYVCRINGVDYNLVGLHLPANPYSDSNARKSIIRNIVYDIEEQEKKLKNRRTIVIGDFNCNPYDEELIEKDAFNAVLFKDLIVKTENIVYLEKQRRRFYNPIIDYLSEESKTYGSLYYSSGSAVIYWNCFDQVLLRKNLIDNLQSLSYVKKIKGKTLLKNIKPNEEISDHLPLLVRLLEGC